MNTILPKKSMTEEDIKLQYITPAITSKWNIRKITMETQITDGKINLKGNLISRDKPKRVDYLLYLSDNNPIAVIEAKDNNHSISHGLQQAMTYAKMFHHGDLDWARLLSVAAAARLGHLRTLLSLLERVSGSFVKRPPLGPADTSDTQPIRSRRRILLPVPRSAKNFVPSSTIIKTL